MRVFFWFHLTGTPREPPSTSTDHGLVHQVSSISLIASGAHIVSGQNGSAHNNSGGDANPSNQRSSNTPCSFSEHKYKVGVTVSTIFIFSLF